jgi:hypothetical protein
MRRVLAEGEAQEFGTVLAFTSSIKRIPVISFQAPDLGANGWEE